MAMSKLSIIMPVLNEGEAITATLDALAELRTLGGVKELGHIAGV